jgi:hypothetical protein
VRGLWLCLTALACEAQVPLSLPNGLKAVLVEQHESAVLRVEVRVPIYDEDLPRLKNLRQPGLPALFLRTLLASPAGRRTPESFAAALEQNGIRLASALDHRGLRFSLLMRNRDLELGLSLLADLLQRTALDHATLEAQRQRFFQDTSRSTSDALQMSTLLAQGGPETPPTEASLSQCSLEQLIAFRARILRPERIQMLLAGDLIPAQARQSLLLGFGAWSPPPQSATPHDVAKDGPLGLLHLPSGTQHLLLLPLPEPRIRPLLECLLRERWPDMRGEGVPGSPWHVLLSTTRGGTEALDEATARVARMKALSFTTMDLERALTQAEAAQRIKALDPTSRLRDLLDEGTDARPAPRASLAELQSAWKALWTF